MIPSNSGHEHLDDNDVIMIIYHVNACPLFQDEMNTNRFFGGNLSVKKTKRC